MAISDAKKRANKKWNDANMAAKYDHVHLVLPSGRKADLQAAADREGESINGYVNKAVLARMGLAEWPTKDDELTLP